MIADRPVSPASVRVLLVGAGGIGAPAAWALAQSGVVHLGIADDDVVDETNLHRQILFEPADVGASKPEALAARLRGRFPKATGIHAIATRALPETALALVRGGLSAGGRPFDVVIDATDNFASRFLLADACHLAKVPVVHAAAIRWRATVFSAACGGRPCYRCLFEDLPEGPAPDCATAGIVGPVCGVSGAIAADRALRLAASDEAVSGTALRFDGREMKFRTTRVAPRADCALCGEGAITDLAADRYLGPRCAD